MPLTRIHLQNFQSHKNTNIQLSPGFNCFIGDSDTGKSAIIKAIYWAVFNKPLGIEFKSHWCGDKDFTEVELEIDNNTVVRKTGKNDNLYLLNNKELRAFRASVPDEVKTALNMSDINLQLQEDPYFLLKNNSAEVARYLNKIIRLDIIDRSFSNIESIRRSTKSSLDHLKKQKDEFNKDLEQYENLGKIEKEIMHLERLENEIADSTKKYYRLIDHYQSLRRYQEKIDVIEKIIKAEDEVNWLLNLLEETNSLKEKYICLIDMTEEVEYLEIDIKNTCSILKAEDKINNLILYANKNKELKTNRNSLVSLYNTLIREKNKFHAMEKELKKLDNEFKKSFPNICPLCGADKKYLIN